MDGEGLDREVASWMRLGVRNRVRRLLAQGGHGLRVLTPDGVLALLGAGAFAPFLALAPGVSGATATAGLGVAGALGAATLTEAIKGALERFADDDDADGRTEEEAANAMAAAIEDALTEDPDAAARLRAEMADVLRLYGAVAGAFDAAAEHDGIDGGEARIAVAEVFIRLGREFGEFGFLLADVRSGMDEIRRMLQDSRREDAADREMLRQVLALLEMSRSAAVMSAAGSGQLLRYSEYCELKMILAGVPAPKGWQVIYRQVARGVVGLRPARQSDDLMSVVAALRSALDPMPLFRFLVQLAAYSDWMTPGTLWNWIDRVAPGWGADVDELRGLEAELRRPFILLRLEPDLLGEGLQVSGWVYEGGAGRQVLSAAGPWHRDRLAAEISRLVGQFDPGQGSVLPVLEFLAPIGMLDDAFDELRVQVGDREEEVGTIVPVVVRPLDRPADPGSRERWRAAWEELAVRGGAYDAGAICWVEHCLSRGRCRARSPEHEPMRGICLCPGWGA